MSGPLQGIRVVELSGVVTTSGPHACMLLADLGADVVRVTRPSSTPGSELGALVFRGRTNVTADLKDLHQRDQVLQIVGAADVLVEGFRPGVTERLGLGPDECLSRNPRLVYARFTGWGQSGPLSQSAGHDINYLSLTGALLAIGSAERTVPPVNNIIGGFGGGSMFLVFGILAALLERTVSGKGQVVDVAMVDGIPALVQQLLELRVGPTWTEEGHGSGRDSEAPYYRTYRCGDGGFVAVGAKEPQFYAQLLQGLGLSTGPLPDREDRSQWPALTEILGNAFAGHSRAHWVEIFEGTDACVTPVLDFGEAPQHPHIAHRQSLVDRGAGVIATPAPRFSRTVPTPSSGPISTRLESVISAWSATSGDASGCLSPDPRC